MRIILARPAQQETATRDSDPPSASTEFSADYWDAFRIAGVNGVRPGKWAASALGGAEVANRAFGGLVWHTMMGFELAPRDATDALVGWHISTDAADKFVLDVDGSRTAGRMVFVCDGDDLLWTTMLRHHSRSGAAIWAVLGKAHRALAPRCLEHARRSLTASI